MNGLYKLIVMFLFVLILGACSSGGDSTPPPTTKTENTLSGTAAAGAPVAGKVNVKGTNDLTVSSSIGIDGSFSLDVSALTAPYILYAEGSVNGKSVKIFSAAIATGTINITPVTDFILRNALAGAAETAFDAWGTTTVSEIALTTATADVAAMLDPLLTAAGVTAGTDLLTTPFVANSTGLDAALDALDISYSGTTATVINIFTESGFTDDITTTGVVDSLPATDVADTTAVLTDAGAINAIWQSLTAVYASTPSSTAIAAWFDNVADDYLENGIDKSQELNGWSAGEGPQMGAELSAAIIEPMAGTPYDKAYLIRINYTIDGYTERFVSTMVFNGASWLWYGNQTWVEVNADAHAYMSVDGVSSNSFFTGFEIYLNDDSNYAYDHGALSAVITGPGLPAGGVVYAHLFPTTARNEFGLYNPSGTGGGSFYAISQTGALNDDAVTAIPDNADYTFTLCTQTPDLVYSNTSLCDAVSSSSHTVMKPPLPISVLDSSYFASLTSHTSHLVSAFNFGGIINVSWTKPVNTRSGEIGLYLDGTWISSEPDAGDTTASLDTINQPVPTTAGLFIRVEDIWQRDFNMGWNIF